MSGRAVEKVKQYEFKITNPEPVSHLHCCSQKCSSLKLPLSAGDSEDRPGKMCPDPCPCLASDSRLGIRPGLLHGYHSHQETAKWRGREKHGQDDPSAASEYILSW